MIAAGDRAQRMQRPFLAGRHTRSSASATRRRAQRDGDARRRQRPARPSMRTAGNTASRPIRPTASMIVYTRNVDGDYYRLDCAERRGHAASN